MSHTGRAMRRRGKGGPRQVHGEHAAPGSTELPMENEHSAETSTEPERSTALGGVCSQDAIDLLSKRELRTVVSLTDQASTLAGEGDFYNLLGLLGELVPIRGALASLTWLSEKRLPEEILLFFQWQMDPNWTWRFTDKQAMRRDPVLQTHFASYPIQFWSQAYRDALAAADLRRVRDGIILGRPDPVWPVGSLFAFHSPRILRQPKSQAILQLLLPHLHTGLVRAAMHVGRTLLTERERDIMRWVVLGKTNWEIGQILGISENTVKFHLQNAMSKLNAVKRSQAAAKASFFLAGLRLAN